MTNKSNWMMLVLLALATAATLTPRPVHASAPPAAVIAALPDGRADAVATPLADGRVLVTGGQGQSGTLTTTLLYDQGAGSWSPAGELVAARWFHTATLLADGRVLVVGGYGTAGGLASAEVYDPVADTWTVLAPPQFAHWLHTATLLADGRVLIAGGYNNGGAAGQGEIFDPATGHWTLAGPMNTPRFQHSAVRLANGQVLVTGGVGYGRSGHLASAELFDPATGQWHPTGAMNQARFKPAVRLLADGRVWVAATVNPNLSAEIYTPATGQWTAITTRAKAVSAAAAAVGNLPAGAFAAIVHGQTHNNNSALAPATSASGSGATGVLLQAGPRVNGAFQFTFSGQPGATFTVLSTTNLAAPNWSVRGTAVETSAGQFQFVDASAARDGQRFYRVITQ